VKPGQLWGKGKDDLKKQLDELKTELGQLRVQKIAGGASSKLTRMYVSNRRLKTHSSCSAYKRSFRRI
jgi:large subunit ribosomal protein L35e